MKKFICFHFTPRNCINAVALLRCQRFQALHARYLFLHIDYTTHVTRTNNTNSAVEAAAAATHHLALRCHHITYRQPLPLMNRDRCVLCSFTIVVPCSIAVLTCLRDFCLPGVVNCHCCRSTRVMLRQ